MNTVTEIQEREYGNTDEGFRMKIALSGSGKQCESAVDENRYQS